MSLDVWLKDGSGAEVFDANITHNLANMADAAGIYECLWRPEECGIERASQLIPVLEIGLAELVCNKAKYEKFNSLNGYGMWEHFVPWCAKYLQACRDFPSAKIGVSR